jgi:hypothetical protein
VGIADQHRRNRIDRWSIRRIARHIGGGQGPERLFRPRGIGGLDQRRYRPAA